MLCAWALKSANFNFLYRILNVIMGLLIWSLNFSPQRQPIGGGGGGGFEQANLQKLKCQGGGWSFE